MREKEGKIHTPPSDGAYVNTLNTVKVHRCCSIWCRCSRCRTAGYQNLVPWAVCVGVLCVKRYIYYLFIPTPLQRYITKANEKHSIYLYLPHSTNRLYAYYCTQHLHQQTRKYVCYFHASSNKGESRWLSRWYLAKAAHLLRHPEWTQVTYTFWVCKQKGQRDILVLPSLMLVPKTWVVRYQLWDRIHRVIAQLVNRSHLLYPTGVNTSRVQELVFQGNRYLIF